MKGLAIIEFFNPESANASGDPPIDLDVDPKNDVGFFAPFRLRLTRTNSYNPVTFGFGLPSYHTGLRPFP